PVHAGVPSESMSCQTSIRQRRAWPAAWGRASPSQGALARRCLGSARDRKIEAQSAGVCRRIRGSFMGRDHNPVPGQWYESLEDEEVFQVLSIDEDSELIELQYEDGDVEEIDYETWQELDLELTEEPEGWSGSDDEDDDDDDE